MSLKKGTKTEIINEFTHLSNYLKIVLSKETKEKNKYVDTYYLVIKTV